LKLLAIDEKSTFDTSALFGCMKQEVHVSKVDYAPKAGIPNIRGVSTIFDTCRKLGHLFPHRFES
jgi:hypothetical protein